MIRVGGVPTRADLLDGACGARRTTVCSWFGPVYSCHVYVLLYSEWSYNRTEMRYRLVFVYLYVYSCRYCRYKYLDFFYFVGGDKQCDEGTV